MTESKFELYDHRWIEDRIRYNKLDGLGKLLQDTGAIIAGSYTLQFPINNPSSNDRVDFLRQMHQDLQCIPSGDKPLFDTSPRYHVPGDIDIWFPGELKPEQIQRTLWKYVEFLSERGYRLPRRYTMRPDPTLLMNHPFNPDDGHLEKDMLPDVELKDMYTRMRDSIQEMHIFSHGSLNSFTGKYVRRPAVQLIFTKGAATAQDVVKGFDLHISRQYYDGTGWYLHSKAVDDIKNRQLTLNLDSEQMQAQSFPEWCRTLKRMVKYFVRGYDPAATVYDDVMKYVPRAYSKESGVSLIRASRGIGVNLGKYITEWNYMSQLLTRLCKFENIPSSVPSVILKARGSGTTVSCLSLGLSTRFMGMDCGSGWLVWNPLVEHDEKEDASLRELSVPRGLKSNRTIMGLGTKNALHVSSLSILSERIKYSKNPPPADELPETVYDYLTNEEVPLNEFLHEEYSRVVFYAQLEDENRSWKAYGVTESQLTNARKFVPCTVTGDSHPNMQRSVTEISVGGNGLRYNVPTRHVKHILRMITAKPTDGRRVGRSRQFVIVPTGFLFPNSRNASYEPEFVGGSANTCGPNTDRKISILQEIPLPRRSVRLSQ